MPDIFTQNSNNPVSMSDINYGFGSLRHMCLTYGSNQSIYRIHSYDQEPRIEWYNIGVPKTPIGINEIDMNPEFRYFVEYIYGKGNIQIYGNFRTNMNKLGSSFSSMLGKKQNAFSENIQDLKFIDFTKYNIYPDRIENDKNKEDVIRVKTPIDPNTFKIRVINYYKKIRKLNEINDNSVNKDDARTYNEINTEVENKNYQIQRKKDLDEYICRFQPAVAEGSEIKYCYEQRPNDPIVKALFDEYNKKLEEEKNKPVSDTPVIADNVIPNQ